MLQRPWFQFWCASIAHCYPLAWLAAALVLTAPRVVQVLVRGDRLKEVRPEYLGFSFGVQDNATRGRVWAPDTMTLLIVILLVFALAAVVFRKRVGMGGGLWLALLGNIGLLPAMLPVFRGGRISLGSACAMVLCVGLLAAGLRQMLKAGVGSSYLSRAGILTIAFVLPVALVPFIYFRGLPFTIGLLFWAPGLALALIVSAARIRECSVWKPRWRLAVAGIVTTLLLILSVQQSRAALERRRRVASEIAMAGVAPLAETAPYPKLFFQRGVNFTSEGPDGYSPETSRPMLEALARHGVDAVALVPYAFSPKNSPDVRFGDGWETDQGIERVAALAHHLSMKVLLKPQVWVGNGYPGDLEFRDAAMREKWFRQYQRYVEHHAGLAKRIHADLFCVGVEFVKLASYQDQWRKLIARARQLYPGPLVYAATQGPEFEGIQFWDAVDFIGLNNYYPLPDDLKTGEVVARVVAVQQRFRKPVIFTEVGFSAYENPHRQPWDETHRKLSLADQARCYEAVFQAFYRQPWFLGMYWWKIGTNGHGGEQDGSFTPWRKPAMEVVGRWYRQRRDRDY